MAGFEVTPEGKVEWVVDGMIAEGSVNLISAESGTGKTFLAYALAGAVAQGVPLIGLPVKQMPVLYLDGENPFALVKERLGYLAIPKTAGLHLWGGWVKEPPPGPQERIVEEFAKTKHGLIIWDSLIEFHPGDEGNASETRKFMKGFRNLANLGATIVLLHHTGKSSTSKKYRGSSDIKAAVDTAYLLEKVATGLGSDKLRRLKMTNFKSRFAPGTNFTMEFVQGQGFLVVGEPTKVGVQDGGELLKNLLAEEPINGTEFKRRAEAIGVSRDVAERFLKEWQHKGPGSKPNEKLYWLPKAA